MSEREDLVKVYAELPDGDGEAEGFWAAPLGNSLYEIRNIVMFVPGLHPLDVVRCEEVEGSAPKVVEVVKASGYKTISVMFRDGATDDQCVDVMWELRQKGVSSEKAAPRNFAFAIPPGTDYNEVVNFLQKQDENGILYFDDLDKPDP
jgi:hypothetical protein